MDKKLCLSRNDKKIAGICGGLGEYFNVDATFVRIIFALLLLIFNFYAVAIYLLCWAIIPASKN